MNSLKLSTGAEIPAIGFGTWEVFKQAALDSVGTALATGYRLIDTARIYSNEKEVGEVIRTSGVARKDIFVTTKLWNDDQGYDSAIRACEAALARLGLDYLDLYLIHWPATSRRHPSWDALAELQRQGLARSIGVSNYTVEHLRELLERSETVPAVNQVEFHPFIYERQKPLLEFCKQKGILVEAYSPLSRLSRETTPPSVRAIAAKHNKSAQQVLLRWCIQHGTVPLPRSRSPEHIQSNFEVFDFELSDEDMERLDALSGGEQTGRDSARPGA
jgi:diketogulonate reductase-like aldo/keto reductase